MERKNHLGYKNGFRICKLKMIHVTSHDTLLCSVKLSFKVKSLKNEMKLLLCIIKIPWNSSLLSGIVGGKVGILYCEKMNITTNTCEKFKQVIFSQCFLFPSQILANRCCFKDLVTVTVFIAVFRKCGKLCSKSHFPTDDKRIIPEKKNKLLLIESFYS